MQPIGSRRVTSTPRRWVPVDALLAQIDERQERTPRRPARAWAVPPRRDPETPAPRRPAPFVRPDCAAEDWAAQLDDAGGAQ